MCGPVGFHRLRFFSRPMSQALCANILAASCHSFIHSLTHLLLTLIYSDLFIHTSNIFIRSFMHSCVRVIVNSCVHVLMYYFIRGLNFVHSLLQSIISVIAFDFSIVRYMPCHRVHCISFIALRALHFISLIASQSLQFMSSLSIAIPSRFVQSCFRLFRPPFTRPVLSFIQSFIHGPRE